MVTSLPSHEFPSPNPIPQSQVLATVITKPLTEAFRLVWSLNTPSRQVEVGTIFLHTEDYDENHLDRFPRSGLKTSEL